MTAGLVVGGRTSIPFLVVASPRLQRQGLQQALPLLLFKSEVEGSSLRVDETLVTLEKPDWLIAERDAMTAT